MKITAKVDLGRLRTKIRKWCAAVDEETLNSLRDYGQEALKQAVKITAPGDGRTAIGTAYRKLRQRIREDWEGQGAEEKYQDKYVKWYRDTSGRPRAYFKAGASSATGRKGQSVTGRVSPFRVVPRKPGKKVLAALNVGRYGVLYVDNVQQHVSSNREVYKVYSKGRGSAARMWWYGPRHIARKADVRKELTRRLALVGRLMAGWEPLAAKVGGKLPAAAKKHPGRGSATVRKSARHGAILSATNRVGYTALQKDVDRSIPSVRRRLRNLARRRARNKLAPKLRKA